MEKKLTYEKLVFNLFYSAGEKLISATELHLTGYSYRTSFFFSIIAQEELSKLILLPLAYELDELEILINPDNKRKSPYYNHTTKQKIFTSFGLQNRSSKQIEKLKQSALYVGYSKKLRIVDKIECHEELENGWRLIFELAEKYVLSDENLSKKTKKALTKYLKDLIKGFLFDKMPDFQKNQFGKIIEKKDRLKKEYKKNGHVSFVTNNIDLLFSNPFSLISFFKAIYKNDYKKHLEKIKYRSIQSVKDYVLSTYDKVINEFKT